MVSIEWKKKLLRFVYFLILGVLLITPIVVMIPLHEMTHVTVMEYHGCNNASWEWSEWNDGDTIATARCNDKGYVVTEQETNLHSWIEIITFVMLVTYLSVFILGIVIKYIRIDEQ